MTTVDRLECEYCGNGTLSDERWNELYWEHERETDDAFQTGVEIGLERGRANRVTERMPMPPSRPFWFDQGFKPALRALSANGVEIPANLKI